MTLSNQERAVRCRQAIAAYSDDDAYTWFAKLHAEGELVPSDDDRLRDRAEAVIRLQRGLTAQLLQLVDDALAQKGTELRADLGGYLPCHVDWWEAVRLGLR